VYGAGESSASGYRLVRRVPADEYERALAVWRADQEVKRLVQLAAMRERREVKARRDAESRRRAVADGKVVFLEEWKRGGAAAS
jgi:hypothetical protein